MVFEQTRRWVRRPATGAEVIPGSAVVMTTAISVPDETYDRAERAAKRLA